MIRQALLYIRLWHFLHQKTSRKLDITDLFVAVILCCSLGFLYLMLNEISISDKEAKNYFENPDLFFATLRWIGMYVGQYEFIIKMPLLLLYTLNFFLLYGICRNTLKRREDSILCLLVYVFLPGVNFEALFLIESGWITFFAFLVAYIYMRYKKIPLVFLVLITFLTSGAMVLLLGIAIFMLKNQRIKTFLFCIVCICLNFYLYDFNIEGRPQTFFLQALGQIAMLYSPLLFVYYIYSIYWGLVQKDHFLSYIAATSIVFCIILSLRQNINFYVLIPQSLVALPIMLQCFLNDFRSRLPQFRKNHYLFAIVIFAFLLLQTSVIFGNKITYFFSDKPNFASSYYFAKEIANQLKMRDIKAIHTNSDSLRMQLLFYGIKDSKKLQLIPTKQQKQADIVVTYNNQDLLLFKISK